MSDDLIYHKQEEVDALIERGILSVENVVFITTGPKEWFVRFPVEVDGKEKYVAVELQRGGERIWKDPRLMFEHCVQQWQISHAKIFIRWKA